MKKRKKKDDDEVTSVKFLPKLSSTCFTFKKGNKRLKYNGSGWSGTVLMTKAPKFAIKLGVCCNATMIGFAPKDINKAGNNNESKGYYLYLNGTGVLYSQAGDRGKNYASGLNGDINDVFGGFYNKAKKTITFYRNGVSLGVAYTNIDKKVPLYPAIDFSTQGSEIDIVKPKFKKEKKKKESDSDKSDSESEDEDELPRFQPKLGSTTVTYQKST